MTIVQIFEVPRSVAPIPRNDIIKAIKNVFQKKKRNETVSVVLYIRHDQCPLEGIKTPVLVISSLFPRDKDLETNLTDILKKGIYVNRAGNLRQSVVNSVEFSWIWTKNPL